MSFSSRFSNGWTIVGNSFKVLKQKKQLIVFPVLSGLSILLIVGSFAVAFFSKADWQGQQAVSGFGSVQTIAVVIMYYILNYFIIVFFNTALVHCVGLYFKGEEVTVRKGLQFSL